MSFHALPFRGPLAIAALASIISCEASSGFRPNNEAAVQAIIVNEMRNLAQFTTRAEMALASYVVSPLVSLSSFSTRLPCLLPPGIDANDNGIPDDLVHVFTATNCISNLAYARGEIRIQDLGAPWGVRVTYRDLQINRNSSSISVENTVDGVLELRQTSDTSLAVVNTTNTSERLVGTGVTRITRRMNNLNVVQHGVIARDPFQGYTQRLPRRVTVNGTISAVGVLPSPLDTLHMAISTTTVLSQTQLFCFGYYSTGELLVAVTGAQISPVRIRFSC